MKRWTFLWIVVGSVLLAGPVAAGEAPTGACWSLAELSASCIPDVTEQQCNETYFWTEPAWNAGSDCVGLDLPFEWDGSCLGDNPVVGERCYLLWANTQEEFTSVEHCEAEDGTWFDNLTCTEVPVPTMPKPALAILAFAVMAGALLALASKA